MKIFEKKTQKWRVGRKSKYPENGNGPFSHMYAPSGKRKIRIKPKGFFLTCTCPPVRKSRICEILPVGKWPKMGGFLGGFFGKKWRNSESFQKKF